MAAPNPSPGAPRLAVGVLSVRDDGATEVSLRRGRRVWVQVPLEQVPKLRRAALATEEAVDESPGRQP